MHATPSTPNPAADAPPDHFAAVGRAYREGRWRDVDALVAGLIAQHPNVAQLHLIKGRSDEHQGRTHRAAEAYQRAVTLDPSLLDAWLLLAMLHDREGRQQDAVVACEAVLMRQPAHRPALLLLASIAEARGDWRLALPLLDRAATLDPTDAAVLNSLFATLSHSPDLAARRGVLERLLTISPHRAVILFQLAYVAQQEHAWERAFALLRQVIQAAPQYLDAHLHLAHVATVVEQWNVAADAYGAALALAPEHAEWWFRRGTMLARAARMVEAEASFREAAVRAPDDYDVWKALWTLRRDLGDPQAAAAAGRRAHALKPADLGDRLQLISALHAADRPDDALRHCRTLARAGGDDVEWGQFMDVLKDFIKVPPRELPADQPKSWDYFHYNRDKVLAMLDAALTIRQRFPHAPRVFLGQGLIAWEKTMGFLDDERFIAATRKYDHLRMMVNWEWNLHVIQWAARQALAIPGDFVELGVYRGYTTAVTAENLDFAQSSKRWFLYDTFAGIPADQQTDGWPHAYAGMESDAWFDEVTSLFASYQNIEVIRGRVPEVFETRCPKRIAFVHIDLNSATAEIGALDALYDRLSPGGVIVFDDYGWYSAREQFDAENRWVRERGLSILELPTGQGLLVKPAGAN